MAGFTRTPASRGPVTSLDEAVLLPPEVRRELRIPATQPIGRSFVQFRLNPGRAFERHGYLKKNADGTANLDILQRYEPGGRPLWIVGAHRVRDNAVPLRLRDIASHVDERNSDLVHWRILADNRPGDNHRWAATATGIELSEAARITARRARYYREFWFLSYDRGSVRYANYPPPSPAEVWSVSSQGLWAFHQDGQTWPTAHGPHVLVPNGEPAFGRPVGETAEVTAEWAECVRPASLDWIFRMSSPQHGQPAPSVSTTRTNVTPQPSPRRRTS